MEPDLLLLAAAALFAGFVDAVAGGGGLVQLPALFVVLPEASAATLFGTNKGASIWGTATAAIQYLQRVRLPRGVLFAALAAALPGAWLGAHTVAALPPASLRPLVLVLLVVVALYTFRRRALGSTHAPRLAGRVATVAGALTGFGLGFYDGLFGPGTGAFLIFVFVRIFGYDFLHASAAAKLVNFATNLAALSFFAGHGHLLWRVAALMAVCNVAGAMIGSRVALQRGAGFVRQVFLGVVCVLIAKIAWDLARG